MQPPYVLYGRILNPVSAKRVEYITDAAIAVGEDGRIAFAGPVAELPESVSHYPKRTTECLITPGFIDLHTHVPQLHARGRCEETLLAWLERHIFPAEERFNDPVVSRNVSRAFFAQLASNGTTAVSAYSNSSPESTAIAFEEAERSGIRTCMGMMLMDRNGTPGLDRPPGKALEESESLVRTWHRKSARLEYAVSPRFAIACSPELLHGAAELAARHDCYIQTHLNEQPGEVAETLRLFPNAKHYTDVYDEAGLLGPRTILGHGIHMREEELALLAVRGCSVAHCPDANLFLGSGRFPIERYAEHGIPYGLGSDVGAGTSLSMQHVMKSMSHVQGMALPAELVFYTATLGNARALGKQEMLGSLETGKEADFVLHDTSIFLPQESPLNPSAETLVELFVHLGSANQIAATVVAGEAVYTADSGFSYLSDLS
ncbi:MAG: guanine deaminase [Ectothiorhodospiraceae bacterium]|nr:guanine deaminase [Ectothiorhodospiraceae bacterium]